MSSNSAFHSQLDSSFAAASIEPVGSRAVKSVARVAPAGPRPAATSATVEAPRQGTLRRIVWPIVAALCLLLAFNVLSVQILMTLRTFGFGEARYSRAQRNAIVSLLAHSHDGKRETLAAHDEAIRQLAHLRTLRLALSPSSTDEAQASSSMVAIGVGQADRERVLWMRRWVAWSSTFQSILNTWERGDELTRQLATLRDGVVLARQTGNADALAPLAASIATINAESTVVSYDISKSLSVMGERVNDVLRVVGALLTLSLALGIVWRTRSLWIAHQRARRALDSERNRAAVTLASIGDAVVTTDAQGRVDYMNPAALELARLASLPESGRGPAIHEILALVDRTTGRPVHPADAALGASEGSSADPASTSSGESEHELVRADGRRVPVSWVASPIIERRVQDEGAGVSHGAVVVLRDTTRERLMLERLGWMASHDSLTRLPNRREFESRVGAAIDTVLESPGGVEHVVMLLDLDQFKIVNDTDGHAAGDELLRQIATVLRARIGPDDTLARMGGDEFAVLLRGCSRDEGERKAETLRRAIQSVSFEWQGRAHSGTTASIGLVHVHAQGLRTIAEIMSAADMACYVAKERGRDQVSVFHAEDQRFTDRFGDMGWPQRIRQAIDEGRMVLYSQPLAGLQPETAGHRRCELLLRLHDEQGALVSPGAFLPAAERYGLMPQIDRWVVDHALRIIASRRRAAPTEHVSYAINLSGSAFGDANFLAEVQRLFDHHAVPFACVCFEITETQAVADLEAAARFIAVLRARGATFALDDFGAGMSSMSYLKHLPVDYLKIDGKLVKDIVTDKVNHAMVEMISRLAQTLGLRTVGEFAEDAAITSALRDIGVHYAQGYGVARPGPFEAVPWVEATTAAAPPAGQADGPAGAAAQAVQRAHDVNELTPEVALLSR